MALDEQLRQLAERVPPPPAADPKTAFERGRRRRKRKHVLTGGAAAVVLAGIALGAAALLGETTALPDIADQPEQDRPDVTPGPEPDPPADDWHPEGWVVLQAGDLELSVPPSWETRIVEPVAEPLQMGGPCAHDLYGGLEFQELTAPLAFVYPMETTGFCRAVGLPDRPPDQPSLVLYAKVVGSERDRPPQEQGVSEQVGTVQMLRTDRDHFVDYQRQDGDGGLLVSHVDDDTVQQVLGTLRSTHDHGERSDKPAAQGNNNVEEHGTDFDQTSEHRGRLDVHEWRQLPAGPIDDETDVAGVWTGTELILWTPTGTGAAYQPDTNSWRELATPAVGAAAHEHQIAVWTGREMIVWGGRDASAGAAIYDPQADAWRQSAPAPIEPTLEPLVVWTGREMLVWGGRDDEVLRPDREVQGAAYDPAADTWRTLADAPLRDRRHPTAVWTGQEMIVWGGQQANNRPESTGAAYDPNTDTWRVLAPAPVSGYFRHGAVWASHEMILWGWVHGSTTAPPENETAAYDPATDTWRMLSPAPFEGERSGDWVGGQAATWTGNMMLGWSGTLDDAGPLVLTFDPAHDTWTRLSPAGAPEWYHPTMVWTGSQLLVWGGPHQGVTDGPDISGAQLRFEASHN